ncbi:MAG: TetR/AcrR family transcriptional regulator [Candidatus Dormibacteraeota bacterium]|nr:TetR/AcrR family transcriptional regulator [Candidatus Dormibacteraeota bacterium]
MADNASVRDKIRDPARSRRAILDAAELLFAERGYEAATMAEIAAAAGLSRGTPAYFFRSKERLYRAVLGRAFKETSELIRSADFDTGRFEDATARTIGQYLDFLAARPSFVRLVVRECLDGGRFLQGLPEHLAAIAEAMRVVGERWPLRSEIDPRHLLLSAISLCWFPMVARSLTADLGFNPDSSAFTRERTKQVVELLLHGALAGR